MVNDAQSKDKELYQKATSYLHTIGLPLHVMGFVYMREAVKICVKNNSLRFGKVFKKIYESIADMTGTTAAAIERNIRHAIDTLDGVKLKKINGLIGSEYFSENNKPTNSMVINLLADKILMDMME